MRRQHKPDWYRLDNAAKIFPPTVHGADTAVFRLTCELTQTVEPAVLQAALDRTVEQYPNLRTVLRRGVFWYYLEQTERHARVVPEHAPPCSPLYEDSRSSLFEVSYWKNKINFDVFHVVADGAGAIEMLQTLVTEYVSLAHDLDLCQPPRAAMDERMEDGFQKYYKSDGRSSKRERKPRAYRLPHRGGDLKVYEGVCDVKQVLDAAHRHNTTLTVYLAAVMFQAIHGGMYVRDRKKPVVLTVPVDLRSYFPSHTARNFFSIIRASYAFNERSGEFSDILEQTAVAFKRELTAENLAARLNTLAALEHNFLLRPIPLFIKYPVLLLSGLISDVGETAALSNIGKFQLPDAVVPYVKAFGVFVGTDALQLCTCTYNGELHLGFTTTMRDPSVIRRVFARLTQDGVSLEVRSNTMYGEGS